MLRAGDAPGHQLRTQFVARAIRKNGSELFLIMGRLEKSGFIEGWLAPKSRGNPKAKERRYRLTEGGAAAWQISWTFYAEFQDATVSKVRQDNPT